MIFRDNLDDLVNPEKFGIPFNLEATAICLELLFDWLRKLRFGLPCIA